MASPKHEIIQTTYQNPHATSGLKLNVMVVSNTSDKVIEENIKYSSEHYPKWLQAKDPHDGVAVLIGGGSSILDHIEDIRELQNKGATVFCMNGSSKWARGQGIQVDYQIIIDAKEESSKLIDSGAKEHLFASQCNKRTLENAANLTLVHLVIDEIESHFPPERVEKGGYVLLNGGTTVGSAALTIAYSQGFRDLHVFGYDSSHSKGKSHAYPQSMNTFMPTTEVMWAGKTFEVSIAMKAQAERFIFLAKVLESGGCHFNVYGEGFLQTIYNTKYEDLTEREKYQLMWQLDAYRQVAPGESVVETFIKTSNPDGLVIDYGCGTGRAGIKMAENGLDVMLVDFTDNCRDQEALCLPFYQADLTEPLPISSPYGYCTDVMEHIPTEDVEKVIDNIMTASKKVFFQISTIQDVMGSFIDSELHLTVKPFKWWNDLFLRKGYAINWKSDEGAAALFYIINPRRN
jgi:hypothetical protein